jgi:hypothetical protein
VSEGPRRGEIPLDALLSRRTLGRVAVSQPELSAVFAEAPRFEPVGPRIPIPLPEPGPPSSPPPPAESLPPPASPPMPPQAPAETPFTALAYPSPGDRIKAEDFRRLSQALQVVADTYALAGATFGYPFGQAKLALAAQQYEIARVVTVSGAEASPADTALDSRKVLHVAPVVLGERRVAVVVTEAAETRRYMPDLRGLTYRQAAERVQAELGDLTVGGAPMITPRLQGLTLTDAARGMVS